MTMPVLPCDDHSLESKPSEVDFRKHFHSVAVAAVAAETNTVEDEDELDAAELEKDSRFCLCCPHSSIHHSLEASSDIDH